MKFRLVALAVAVFTAGAAIAQTTGSYDAARKALVTTASHHPSPQDYENTVPKGVEAIHYAAKDGQMLAWVIRPKEPASAPLPVVVYAHGGFALGGGDDIDGHIFADAGFIVVMPTLRGENGNPGNFELFLGEVDDLIAVAKTARTLPGADPERMYLFGHSIGGGLATLVALSDENPYKLVGATGGNYSSTNCDRIAKQWGTFDAKAKNECLARFPDAYLPTLKTPLFSYVGEDDGYARAWGNEFKTIANENYHLLTVKGDHFGAVAPSIHAFVQQIRK